MADEQMSGSGGPTIKDLNAMVEVDGEVFRLSDLIESLRKAGTIAEEVSDLRVFHESASKFMRREGEQHEIADAASKMLKGIGYSDDETRQYIKDWTNSQNSNESDAGDESEEEETTQENSQMEQNDPRYAQLENETRQMRLRMMRQEMEKGVTEAIDTNSDIAKMLFGLDKTRGREHASGAYQAIQDQIRKATLDRLYDRRDKTGGNFSEDWIQEEAAQAAADVAKSYSTVIGDLGQLGRTPETVSEMDTIAAKPPVAPPEFKKGMDRGSVDTAMREYNTDALSRIAMEVSAGGETKA